MVSTKTLNGVLKVITNFMLDKKSISELSKINLIETKYALDVLVSNGYVLRSNSKGINDKGQKYSYVYYVASESAKEILNDGGFTKQLSMKEKSKTSVKNKLSIKDSTVNGQVNQGSLLENSPINSNTNAIPSKNEPKSIWFRIWKFTDHKLIAQIILIIISLILGYFGFKYLK
jgi:hypothetical protein